MLNFIFKKIFFILFIFLIFSNFVFGLDIVEDQDISINARVIDSTVIEYKKASSSGGFLIPQIGVSFKGYAYPNSEVFILKNGVNILSVFADNNAYFSALIPEEYQNTVLYTIYTKDTLGNKSIIINYPIVVKSGYITELSNILFPPTIFSDKIEVKEGDYITFAGYSRNNKVLELIIKGKNFENIYTVSSLFDGSYKLTIPIINLEKGEYIVSIKYIDDSRISKILKIIVGDNNISNLEEAYKIAGDCNKDDRINLIDFSIFAFWYKKVNPPICVDLNKDNIINLIDFSILAYYWTG